MNPENNTFNPDQEPATDPSQRPAGVQSDQPQPVEQPVQVETEPATSPRDSDDALGNTINAAPAPAVQPTSAPSSWQSEPAVAAPVVTPGLATPKPRSKKPLVIGLVVGGVLLLLGGTAAAYQFWYQNPDKVVTDSIVTALTAKTVTYTGTVDTSGEAAKLKVEFDGKSNGSALATHAKATITMGAANVVVDGDVQFSEKGDVYFKIKNAKDLSATFVQMMGGSSTPEIDALIAKVDNKWIKASAEDFGMDEDGDAAKQSQCFEDVIGKFRTDRGLRDEVTGLYAKQRFITVKQSLGEKDGNLGYKLDADQAKAKQFAASLKTTALYRELQKCDKDFKIDENDVAEESSDFVADVEIWANKWSHELTQVKVSGEAKDKSSKGAFVLNPVFSKEVTVASPSDAVPLSELQSDFEAIVTGQMTASTSELSEMESGLMSSDLDQ
jgi:hypothetical protein